VQTTRAGELSAFATTADRQYKPARNSRGDVDLFILERLKGKLTVAEIAQQTERQFPDHFSGHENVEERIYRLINRYAY
jgi:hypothetical protein